MGVKIYDADQLLLDFEEPIYVRDTSSITEQAGYVDAETQVKRMMVAGSTLMDFKRGMFPGSYEFGPDDDIPDDVKPDPTLDVCFDLADASSILADTESKIALKKVELEKAKVSKKVDEGTEKTVAET